MSACMLPNTKGVPTSAALRPENFTMWRTSAFVATSMNRDCRSAMCRSEEEINSTRSTPESASSSVCGRDRSPSTTCTVGNAWKACAFARLLTSALTGYPFRTNSRITADPATPVAPVTRIVPSVAPDAGIVLFPFSTWVRCLLVGSGCGVDGLGGLDEGEQSVEGGAPPAGGRGLAVGAGRGWASQPAGGDAVGSPQGPGGAR